MSAEPRPPDPLTQKGLTVDEDIKDSQIHHRQQERKHQGRASGERSCFLGLETKPELVWEDWELGREFTETLVLKNTHTKLKKLHIRPPVSKFFSTLIPQEFIISPGLSFSLPVTFRPLQMCEYEDNIEFQCKEGSFQVCLRAIVPCHTLEVPESVILPHCAVQHSSRANFLLKNVSKLITSFQWDCAAPFQLSPQTGILKPGQESYIEVVFQPQEVLEYQQQASCRFGGEEKTDQCCAVLLKGQAKNPYLELRNYSGKKEEDQRNPVLDFGSVVIGQSLRKHFDIFNPSPVNASFSLSQLPNMVPVLSSVFRFDVTKDKVAPGRSVRASVTYSPTVVDAVSVDYLSLKYGGALKKNELKLTGKCIGPVVCLSSSLVDFGCVKEGGSVVQKLDLINSSPAEAFYQWDIDGSNSVFSIQPESGTVLPHSSTKLTTVYRPMQPNAHHRRVACLILHRDPLFLDMIGTCHTELHKPPILKPEHLDSDKLQWYHRQQQETVQDSTAEQLNQTPKNAARSTDESSKACMEYLNLLSSSSSLSSSPVSIVPKELLFNHKKTISSTSSSAFVQFVTIKNHTRQNLRLVWTVCANSPFAVSPSLRDLASLKSTAFRIIRESKQLNTLHGAQLECFAYCKDGTHPGEQLVCPPWCMTVRVIAHSFQTGKEHFTPHCSLKPSQVVFPSPGASSYQTVLLQNNGDLPLTFCLDHRFNNSSTESVCILPTCGFIQPGHHQILTLRAIPTEDSPKQGFNLSLQLNAAQFTRVLTVFSVAEKPCVSLESGSSLHFHPTAVGSESHRTHHIRNLSCLPVRFQWSIPDESQQLIFVKPDAGELHPNDTAIQTWSFCPLAEETYRIKSTLTFWSIKSDGSNKTHLFLEVFGIGSKGSLEAEKAVMDLGEILVGSYHTVEVALVNSSPCSVSFSLSVEQILTDDAEQCELKLDCERGTIASHSKIQLQSTCRPGRQAQYIWTISYQTLNASGSALCPPEALCEVRAKGVFPTLQVIESCGSGSVGMLSKGLLWKLFSLHSLNEHLLSTPSDADLTFTRRIGHSLQSCPSIFTEAMLDFNFGSAPLNSDPSDFVLTFYNPGLFPVNWAFLFPEDKQIDLKYWTMRREFSNVELDHMKRQDNHIFSISPRSGTLLPGHNRTVYFSYRHDFVGTNQLPIIFRLSHGRVILLKFQGVTVERNKPCVLFASPRHIFTPVYIGDSRSPRQMYELHNGGEVPVHYEVDAGVLSQLRMNNFEHSDPALHCLNPEGDILPGKTAMLEWIFCPLEATTYHMDVPIHIQNTETTVVRFVGCGLGTLMPDSSKTMAHGDCKGSEGHDQRTPLHGQVLFLSEDSIFIGDIPVYTKSSRIVFLTNVSHTDTAHYMWDLQSNQQVVQIHPDRGRLRPGECALCHVTFTPANYPTIYQLDLICQVTLEAALVQYQLYQYQNWEEEQKRQQNVITDKNVPEIREVDKEALATPARKQPPFSKYKILPPICASSDRKPLGNLHAKQTRAEANVVRCPQPPKPALLHLTVSAHTHEYSDFVKMFPEKNIKKYRYHNPVNTSGTIAFTRLPATGTLAPSDLKREVIEGILTTMIWEIFDDPDFVQTLYTLASKPRRQPREPSSNQSPNVPSPPSTPQPHVLLSETTHREGATGCLESRKPVLIPADICEDILLNTLHNVMMEAVRGEFDLTSYPPTHHPDTCEQ